MSVSPLFPAIAPARACLFLLLCLWLTPAAATPLGLPEAMRLAGRDAPSLQAREAMRRAAGEQAARSDALPDPQLVLGVDNLPATGPDAGRFGADDMTMRRIGLMQEWPLPSKRRARRAVAEAAVLEAEAELREQLLEVRREAALAWVAAWRSDTGLALLDELEIEVARAAELVEQRLASGVGSASEALAAQAERAALQTRRLELQADRDAARALLARWLGAAAARPLGAPPAFEVLPHPPVALRAGVDRHAALQPARARVLGAERNVALAQAERRPDLRFEAAWGARSGADDMVMFEVGIGLPVARRQRQDRDLAARRAEHDAATAELEDLRRLRQAELDAELARWDGLRARLAHYREELLPLARDRGRLALAALRGGGGLQTWLEAHHAEIELRLDYTALQAELAERWVWLSTLLAEDAP